MSLTTWNVFKSSIEFIVLILVEIFGDSRIACLSILLNGANIAKVDKSCKLDVSASTSLLNFFYEGKNQLNKKIVKVGFTGLRKVKFLRHVFIKQAMGRINLTD